MTEQSVWKNLFLRAGKPRPYVVQVNNLTQTKLQAGQGKRKATDINVRKVRDYWGL